MAMQTLAVEPVSGLPAIPPGGAHGRAPRGRAPGLSALWAAVVIAGCGPEPGASGPEAPTDAAGAPPPVTAADLDAVERPGKTYKVALIVKTRNNPFFKPMIEAFEATARELGVEADIQAPPQEMDKEKQFALVQAVVGKKVDAICIAPADSQGIVPALKAAQDAGIAVVNLDNRVDASTALAHDLELAGYVGADNEAGGKLAGEALKAALEKSGAREVAILEGIRGVDNAEARKRGFEAGVEGLRIVAQESAEWDTEKGYQKTQNILARHPDLAGLFCANDKMAVGALKAIREAGRQGKIHVIGYDNIPDVQAALKSGELHATIEQHPDLMGKYGLRMAVGVLTGKVRPGGEVLVDLEVVRGKP